MAFLLRLVGTLVISHVTLLLAFVFFPKFKMAWKEKALMSLIAGVVYVIADTLARGIIAFTAGFLSWYVVWVFIVITVAFMLYFTGQVLFERMGMGPDKSRNLMFVWFALAGVLLWLLNGWMG